MIHSPIDIAIARSTRLRRSRSCRAMRGRARPLPPRRCSPESWHRIGRRRFREAVQEPDDILRPFTQRRYLDRKHRQPEIEVPGSRQPNLRPGRGEWRQRCGRRTGQGPRRRHG
jgi:hypothetical protein